ncbi:Protein GRISEA [Penicillium rolfsii]|nr:Protein GRISEA [Penicillium rolfsii]
MPLDEEGAKWSCEPCIRGHRSSKCQHFDRLMMKVPKAGRPLAKCPHPKGTCSCQKTYAFMVRIPKGSSCLCRPLYKVPAGDNDSSQPTPVSMPSVSSPSGKVQKSGRRQSSIQATPENIAKALEAMPDNLKLEDGASSHLENLPSYQSEKDEFNDTRRHQAASVPQGFTLAASGSSCCSSKPQPPSVAPAASQGTSSCCSGKKSVTNSVADDVANSQGPKPNPAASWNDMSYMNFPAQEMPPWQNSMASTQENFVPSYGMQNSRTQSFYVNGYTPHVSSAPHSNSMPGLRIAPPDMAPFTMNRSQFSAYASTAFGGDTSHDCSCGDDCQCLGCAAHPFNNTTRQHVQEMGVMMTFNGDDPTPEAMANTYNPPSFTNNAATTPMNFFMPQTPSMDHGVHQSSFEPYSDPNSTIPSGYSSPIPAGHHFNQQLMHPSEYYTIEYPVGIPSACSDVTGSCQCGNDCSCVGCLTHSGHNGVALDPPIPDAPVANSTENGHSSHETPTMTAGSPTSRIPRLENVSMPCLSPRILETSTL